jgi:hypothetical protein
MTLPIYNRLGEPIDMDEYVRLHGNSHADAMRYARVDETDINDDVYVSTVWLGLDHNWGGRPHIFETMVFGGPLNEQLERYSTEATCGSGPCRMGSAGPMGCGGMNVRDVYTESGTIYTLDFDAGTVERHHGAPMRGDDRVLRMQWCGTVALGLPLRLILEPLGGGDGTMRTTSPVVSIVTL